MPEEEQDRNHFVRGLGESTRHNSLAYGFSLALTGAFGVLATQTHETSVVDVFLFAIGGSIPFTLANVGVTSGFRYRVDGEPPILLALGASFGFFSVCGAIGVAALIGWAIESWVGWLLGAFAASSVYLVATAGELVLARAIRALLGRERLEER